MSHTPNHIFVLTKRLYDRGGYPAVLAWAHAQRWPSWGRCSACEDRMPLATEASGRLVCLCCWSVATKEAA